MNVIATDAAGAVRTGAAVEALAYDIRDVSLSYGSTAALRGLSLQVRAGETVALIGPSGAGKTTLLRLMAGMLPPTSGEVRIMGRRMAGMKPGRELTSLVGMMQQQLDLVPQLAVKHNVQAGLLGRWTFWRSVLALVLPAEVREARQAVERVGLGEKFLERVGRLSGGEQQRVALARVLVQDPAAVLADEPVSSLDPALADDLLALLRDLTREAGKTLVASMHIPTMATRYFDRVVALRDGQIAFDTPVGEVGERDLEDVYRLEDRQPFLRREAAQRNGMSA